MSTWLAPAVVATLASSVVLALVYLYLWHQDRDRSLAIWALSWSVYAVRYAFMLVMVWDDPVRHWAWLILNQLASLASGLLLLWGALVWAGKRMGLIWLVPGALCAVWITASPSLQLSFLFLSLPTFVFLGLVYIAVGWLFLRADRARESRVGRAVVGITLILWGLHKVDFPFLKPVAWFAPWGYLIGAILGLIAAVGIVLIYFECTRSQLSQSREDLRTLIQQANSAVLRIDPKGRIVFANDFALRLFGYETDELIGEHVVGTVVPEVATDGEELRDIVVEVYGDPESHRLRENENRRKDGSRLWMSWSNNVMRDDTGKPIGLLTVGHDLTAAHETQRAKEALEEQMRRSQRLETVGQLAGGVAHDFNNLLQAIDGYTELARDDLEPTHPVNQSLDEITRAASRATTLVRQLLAFSRREAFLPRAVDVNALIGGLMRMLERLIGEHIQMAVIPGHDLPPVSADPGQVEQAITNLVVNARDAMRDGGRLTIRTRMANRELAWNPPLEEDADGERVAIEIADTGCGIDADVREHIFEPFFTTKEVGEGTGLGLSTVYGIIAQHGGSLCVASEQDKGTTFSICLPVADQGHSDGDGGGAPDDESQYRSLRGRTVLLAEDEDQVRGLICHILTRHGCDVVETVDGQEALDVFRARSERVDLAILDIVMPRLGGVEACKEMRRLRPDLPVLFCSGYSERERGHEARGLPNVRLLPKPFSSVLLLENAHACLSGKGRSPVDNTRPLG